MKKKLGILGGMGPLASKVFYERIIKNTKASSDNDHIDIMLLSHASIPDRTRLILKKKDPAVLLNKVAEDINVFESYGVSNIAAACNTFHYFLDQVQELTAIPFINMVDLTVKEAAKHGKTVTVLATKGTLKTGIYDKYLDKYGLDHERVGKNISNELMNIIYGVMATNNIESDRFNQILSYYISRGSIPILACTELSSLILDADLEEKSIDALSVLTREAILRSGYNLKYDKIKS